MVMANRQYKVDVSGGKYVVYDKMMTYDVKRRKGLWSNLPERVVVVLVVIHNTTPHHPSHS